MACRFNAKREKRKRNGENARKYRMKVRASRLFFSVCRRCAGCFASGGGAGGVLGILGVGRESKTRVLCLCRLVWECVCVLAF
jgi:hypothetical protein